jgi:hypothetical protein
MDRDRAADESRVASLGDDSNVVVIAVLEL